MSSTITFNYLNHRGETEERTIDVAAVEFQRNPGYGYQPGWFISGFCHDRKARRSFALNRIILPEIELRNTVVILMRMPS